VALYVYLLGQKGFILTLRRTIFSGIALGVVAGIVSAPVVVLVFGGLSGSGAALITAFLLASGKTVLQSVFLAGLASEPLDKTLQLLLARYILLSVPRSILRHFSNPALQTNGLQ
jgi:energy-coupling factor transport system substrate-specific component